MVSPASSVSGGLARALARSSRMRRTVASTSSGVSASYPVSTSAVSISFIAVSFPSDEEASLHFDELQQAPHRHAVSLGDGLLRRVAGQRAGHVVQCLL